MGILMLSLSFGLKQKFSRAFPLTSGQQFDCSPRIHEISIYLYYTGTVPATLTFTCLSYPIVRLSYPIVRLSYPIVRLSYQVFRLSYRENRLSGFAFIVYQVLRLSGFPFIVFQVLRLSGFAFIVYIGRHRTFT